MKKDIGIVYLAAGVSERFNYAPKGLQIVGENGETLIEFSLNQSLKSGFNQIYIIVGDKTEAQFKKAIGNSYRGVPVRYIKQTFNPKKRERPWGQIDAVSQLDGIINVPFVVANSDDIYGEESFRKLYDHLNREEFLSASVWYSLRKVLPKRNPVNRGIFEENNGYVKELKETSSISLANIHERNIPINSKCGMGLFAFFPENLKDLSRWNREFKIRNKDDPKIENPFGKGISYLISQNKLKMKLYFSESNWMGITYPEDLIKMRKFLKKECIPYKMKKKILFLGRFPMPMHGAAKMNELYFINKQINDNFELRRIKLGESSGIEKIGKFSFGKISGFLGNMFKLSKKLRIFNPDIIYFEIPATGIAFIRDSFYAILCRLFHKKIIFHLHSRGIKDKAENFLWKKYYKFIFRNNKVILLSKLLYDELDRVVPEKDIHILPNGIEDEVEDAGFNRILSDRKKNKKLVLLFLSNMIEEKGALDVLKICDKLNRDKIDFECVFAGPWQESGFKERWENLMKKLELEKKCKYAGARYEEERRELFAKADFMVFPTTYRNESFPLVILEAFMYGIPVFAYNNGAIKEIISDENLGFFSEKGDWNSLAEELKKRLKKKTNASAIRKHFKENFLIDTAGDKLMKVFQNELKLRKINR